MWRKGGQIFISYRRDDASAEARNIHDRLARRFGSSTVFMDVDNLFAGQRFDVELGKALERCEVLIVVIGSRWSEVLADHTARDERDYVREEIAAALRRGIRIIPALVGHEGRMPVLPRRGDLPNDIRDFVLFQKQNLVHESFSRDATELIAAIEAVRSDSAKGARRHSWTTRVLVAGPVAAVAMAGLLYFAGIFPKLSLTPPIVAMSPDVGGHPRPPMETKVGGPPPAQREAKADKGTVQSGAAPQNGPILQSEPPRAPRTYFVQLSAHPNEAAARGGFADQKFKHPALLGSWDVTILPADLGAEKGVWYRTRLGPFFAESEAAAFCGRLRAARIGCQFPPPP
jgi:hypothetical protein